MQFVTIDHSSDDQETMPADTAEQIEAIQAAMAACDCTQVDVYTGDPDCPDSYFTGRRIFAEQVAS